MNAIELETDSHRPVHARAVLIIACVAQFMVVLDISIVNVALPAMRHSLHLSPAGQQWIVNAYALVFGGCLLCGGRAADLFGRRRTLTAGLALFTASSLVGGLSQSGDMLIAARAVQGLGAAVLAPATLSLITTTFTEPVARTKALTAWSATAASGGAAGAALGGVLTQALSWRWVLFVNVPIGTVLVIAAQTQLSGLRPIGPRRNLDATGALLVTSGLALLVYALVTTDVHPWGSLHTLGLLVCALVLLTTFFVWEARIGEPMVPLSIFRSRALSGANVIAMLLGGVIASQIFFLSLYLQQVNGYSPLHAGVVLLIPTLGALVAALTSGRLVGRTGPRLILIVGPLLSACGQVWLSRIHAHQPLVPDIALASLITVLGLAACFVPMTMSATAGVEMRNAGLASGLLNSSRQIGGAVCLAALVAIATSATTDALRHHTSSSLPAALTVGYDRAFLIGACLTVLMAVVSATVLPRMSAQRSITADVPSTSPEELIARTS